MTLQEFKAWFEGFTESMDRAPTAKQWERIKKRVKEIDGSPVTERVFIDRYWPPCPPYRPWWGYLSNNTTTLSVNSARLSEYQSNVAMFALGRADAQGDQSCA